jgi:hypothetical protein
MVGATITATATDAIATMTVAHPPLLVLTVVVTRIGPSHTHIVKTSTTRRAISLRRQTTPNLLLLHFRRFPCPETIIDHLRATSLSASRSLPVYKNPTTHTAPALVLTSAKANSLDRMGLPTQALGILADHRIDRSRAIDAVGAVAAAVEAVISASRLPTGPC